MIGVRFGSYHSYDDLKIIMTKRPDIEIPLPKTSSIDIEGADGVIDTTEALTDVIHYHNRKIVFIFKKIDRRREYTSLISEIANKIHGKRLTITLDDDQGYYYVGRVSVSQDIDSLMNTFTITCDCEPYKYNKHESHAEFMVVNTLECKLNYSGTQVVCPTLIVTKEGIENIKLVLNGTYYPLSDGENVVPDFLLRNGKNEFSLEGTGTVKLKYREGVL